VLVVDVLDKLRDLGLGDLPVVIGGIIPDEDATELRKAGVRRIYTPKDFDLTRIMSDIVDVVEESRPAA
jgi:(2R)-ethylmalonyl-CoA mutase